MKQKLYTKNEKGRYEEYQIPDMDVSDTLFRRINGKYVPVSINCANDLPEGVWVVTRGRSRREIISGKYLQELMMLEKASDLKEMPSLAELGGWHKCAKYVLDEIGDIKTAVSEAVTNAIVHAYPDKLGKIVLKLKILEGNVLEITVRDWGRGIEDIQQAREPLFTTGGEERSGMGFTIMESFMDRVNVRSAVDKGTSVVMRKRIAQRISAKR